MKRNKKTFPKVKVVKPLFWKECRFCHREFKNEEGYKIQELGVIDKLTYNSYCCNECAKSIEEVKNKLGKTISIKLPPPPGFKVSIKES